MPACAGRVDVTSSRRRCGRTRQDSDYDLLAGGPRTVFEGTRTGGELRATDARKFYEQAAARDANFALAHLGLANTAGTTKEFIDAVSRAATLVSDVSEGERHMVLGLDAAMKGNVNEVLSHYTELVRLFPNDERAHTLLGNLYFGRQEYDAAVKEFVEATTITPSFSQPYNQLGYAYRFLDKLDEAETAFKKYVQLIPDDPNPHDSYAELLMKRGRFDESIKAYEKALSLDANFVASHIGIGNNYLCQGRADQARTAFARITAVARNTGERGWRISGLPMPTFTTGRPTRRSQRCARDTRSPRRSGMQARCRAISC